MPGECKDVEGAAKQDREGRSCGSHGGNLGQRHIPILELGPKQQQGAPAPAAMRGLRACLIAAEASVNSPSATF